jgi:hypothetical protein
MTIRKLKQDHGLSTNKMNMHSTSFHIRLALFLTTLLCGGCISTTYPDSWPRRLPVQPGECPDLNGTYKDIGSRAFDTVVTQYSSFSSILKNDQITDSTSGGYFTIRNPDARTMEITCFDREGNVILQKKYSAEKGEFLCDEEGVAVERPLKFAASNLSAVSWGKRHYAKADDGSFVVREDETGIFALIIVPVGFGSQRQWFLHQRISEAEEPR